MSSTENISRKRLFLCSLFGIAIVAVIAAIQPSGKETISTGSAVSPMAEAMVKIIVTKRMMIITATAGSPLGDGKR